jgi:prepilin-type N-terminal cleavage/methylation domain-containing protein
MNRRRRGYSLVEMLTAVAILGVAMGTLDGLLRQGMKAVVSTRAAEMTPQLDTAWLVVRRDVQAATAAPRGGEAWVGSALDLGLSGGRTVRLALRNGALVREERTAGTDETVRSRVLARPVRSFRWRVPAEGLVEVELTPARAYDADAARAASPAASTVLCAIRGAGLRGGGW